MPSERTAATVTPVLPFPWSIDSHRTERTHVRRASYDELTSRGLLNFDTFLGSFRDRIGSCPPSAPQGEPANSNHG